MNDSEIIEALRLEGTGLTGVQLAELLDKLTAGQLSDATMVTYFKRAFPAIPLKVLLDAGRWKRVSYCDLSDEEFNELLRPYLPATD
jgi:hypothetical protein